MIPNKRFMATRFYSSKVEARLSNNISWRSKRNTKHRFYKLVYLFT